MQVDEPLLRELYTFLKGRSFVTAHPETIKQLTRAMKHPPLTLHHRVVMQMTAEEFQQLSAMLTRIEQVLHAPVPD